MTARPTEVKGLPYGENKRLNDAQAAIPLPSAGAPAGAAPEPAPVARPDIFAATERPGEPMTAGQPILPDDPLLILRAAVQAGYDTDGSIRRLLERMSANA